MKQVMLSKLAFGVAVEQSEANRQACAPASAFGVCRIYTS